MKKTPSKKLSLHVETIRNLTSNELTHIGGGSLISLASSGSGASVATRIPTSGLPSSPIYWSPTTFIH
jgi:hypothetical protein